MRIGVSGPHGTGKTTLVEDLCERLAGHVPVDEPFVLLEEEGYGFEHPPSVEDYWAQYSRCVRSLCSPAPRVVFDRTPLDFLAYLAALGADVGAAADPLALRSALASLDLLVIVPISHETERVLPRAELPRLRAAMNDALLDLIHDDPLGVCRGVRTIELRGPLEGRVAAVIAALPRPGEDAKRRGSGESRTRPGA
ncbi:MAG TPA: AAA family ATPase [Thermomicrobiales bacterium]|nr:AAA family ATPase [Thermomicrobiales bacterium]